MDTLTQSRPIRRDRRKYLLSALELAVYPARLASSQPVQFELSRSSS